MRYKVTMTLCGVLSWIFVFSQFRKYSNEFLNIGAGAKALGMGAAFVASADDHTAGYWNPAGLSFADRSASVGFMHAEYFSGIGKYDFLAAALPTNNEKRTIGITALRFGVDDIPNTLFLVEPDGTINYNNIKSFSSADYAFLFSAAQLLKQEDEEAISIGGSAKIIYRQVGSFAKAWGFGADVGITARLHTWRLAATIKDVTTTFNVWSFNFSEEEKERLYLTQNDIPVRSSEMTAPRLTLAVAKEFSLSQKIGCTAETNIELSFDGQRNTAVSTKYMNADPRIGIQFDYNKTIFLRAGVNNFQKALADGDTLNKKKVWIYQPSLGAGFRSGNVSVDYAFSNLANQSNPLYSHIVSLQIILSKKKEP